MLKYILEYKFFEKTFSKTRAMYTIDVITLWLDFIQKEDKTHILLSWYWYFC